MATIAANQKIDETNFMIQKIRDWVEKKVALATIVVDGVPSKRPRRRSRS